MPVSQNDVCSRQSCTVGRERAADGRQDALDNGVGTRSLGSGCLEDDFRAGAQEYRLVVSEVMGYD